MLQGVAVTSVKEEAPLVPTRLPGDLVFLRKMPSPETLLILSRDQTRNPTKFTEEPKEAWRTLADGGVGTQASASIPAIAVIENSCVGVGRSIHG